jgi:predicted DNA binding protein
MIVAEIEVDSPLLREALARAPAMALSHEEQYLASESINYLFWARSGDFVAFEEGLAADRTVTNVTRLAETSDGRLYRVTFTEYGERFATFPVWSELDVSVVDSTGTHEGWEIRLRLPDREGLRRFRDACEERGVGFQLGAIYDETGQTVPAEARLTDAQREALTTSCARGYYDIPRRTTMAEVASELELSSQALSERLRRGTKSLVQHRFSSRLDD